MPQTEYELSAWKNLYPAVDRALGNISLLNSQACQQWVNAIRVDLTSKDIQFLATPTAQLQGDGVTATDFLKQNFVPAHMSAMLGVNANEFDMDDRTQISGYSASGGMQVSAPSSGYPWSLLVEQDNGASIRPYLGLSLSPPVKVWTAVSGKELLVKDGQNVAPSSHPPIAARTAVGLSPPGSNPPYLYIVTLDGIEGAYFFGGSLSDAAEWLIAAGAFDGLNLDGGGSTTMAEIHGSGSGTLMNVPFGDEKTPGKQRPVGNCFGLIIKSIMD